MTAVSPLRDLAGFLLLFVAVFALISLASFSPLDPSFNTAATGPDPLVRNYGGVVGSYLADLLMQIFGYAAFLLPAALFGVSWGVVFGTGRPRAWLRAAGLVALLCSASLFLGLLQGDRRPLVQWGGAIGQGLRHLSLRSIGKGGAYLASLAVFATALVLSAGLTYKRFLSLARALLKAAAAVSAGVWRLAGILRGWLGAAVDRGAKEFERGMEPIRHEAGPELPKDRIRIAGREVSREEAAPAVPIRIPEKPADKGMPRFHSLEEEPAPERKTEKRSREYRLPSPALLEAPETQTLEIDRDELFQNAQIVERKLKDFGVFGKVVEVQPGPVVTMYEFEPAPGVKVNQLTRLNEDLALALKALSVRIEPIPGKAVIGIEVANRNRQVVYLKEILSNEVFTGSGSRLTLALGKDISGTPVVTDLRRMPHLLVAGATGSGKSVAVNSMILSVLYKCTPDEVRMILVDPKMLELSFYEEIPHLLLPVVTDPRKASAAMRWVTGEMERRYRLMADIGVRNVEGYNKKVLKVLRGEADEEPPPAESLTFFEASSALPVNDGEPRKEEEHTGKLPYIMVVIDELADLMMVSSREVEESIIRLAQMARAAGIHLLLATQRPSVDVITGVIKANMPARISFQVSSKIDSRTILDTNGAELLLGAGDMLFLPPGTSKLQRIHGAFVTDNEVKRVTDFWKEQGRPDFTLDLAKLQEQQAEAEALEESGEDDEMYRQALGIVRTYRVASISMIQRKLRIGYNRAARIVERMEEEGLLAPGEVGKPREVILSRL